MENRKNRLFQIAGPGPRALPVVCAVALPFLLLTHSFATACDALIAGEPAILQTTLQIRGATPVKQSIQVYTSSEVMIFARERGVDITLEVLDSKDRVVASADSPIGRTGTQRLELMASPAERYYIVLTGKDHADSNGSVDIRVVDLRRIADSSCLSVQKLLARAEAAYAAAEAVARGFTSEPGADSGKSYREAAAGYRQASLELEALGPSPLLAQAQLAEASILNLNLDSFVDSREWAQRSARTFASLGDEYGQARARATDAAAAADTAVSVTKSGTTDATKQAAAILAEARQELGAVVAFHAGRRELHDQAWAQNYIGITYYYENRYDEAIRAYKKAIPLYEKLHERNGQVQVLQNLALAEEELGRASEAVPHYRQALNLIRQESNPRLLTAVLANSAQANIEMGKEDAALRELSESLALARTTQNRFWQALDLRHMASAYARLGDQTRALDFERQALALFTAIQYVRGQTISLGAIAYILREQGHADEALKMDREARSLETAPWARQRTTVNIAKDLIALGRGKEAAGELSTILDQNADINEVVRARALQQRAELRAAEGDLAGAEVDLKAALATFKTYELALDEFTDWISQVQLMRRRGANAEAFAAIDQALALAEEVRLYSANPELRSTLLQPLRPAFDLKISMLFDQYAATAGKPTEQNTLALRALQTAEQARARALSDYQAIDTTVAGLDPTLLERRRMLYRELAARRSALEASLERTGTVDNRNQTIRSDIATLRQELDQIDAQIGAASERALTHQRPTPKVAPLPLVNIPADVAIVEYWLGAGDSFAWVVTKEGLTMASIGPSDRINKQAIALHTALRSFGSVPKAERLDAGEKLYALVLGPLSDQLTGKHTLILALDGALHYVPFATLRYSDAGNKLFLVQTYDVAVTPSLQLFLRPDTARARFKNSTRMLLVDDPVYDRTDPRVAHSSAPTHDTELQATGPTLALVRGGGSGGYLPRLPGAAREATAIAALLPSETVDRLEGFAANRERFLTSSLAQYRLIHVASHATTDSEIPQASALILSMVDAAGHPVDGRVLGADFMGVRLNADTVVLSACDTALGKSVAGEGLIGLQYVVLARGARSVVSSLWPAIDQVTADLMVKFYARLVQQNTAVISAWSAASRAALQGPYSDPGTWGAFMLTLSHVQDLNTTSNRSGTTAHSQKE